MVDADFDPTRSNYRFVIRPNCSLSWRGSLLLFGAIAIVALGIAAVFSLKGAWMIAPFAGLELLILAISLYVCAQRCVEREVICVHPEIVSVERGRYRPLHRIEFLTAWAQVRLTQWGPVHYPARLTIGSHGREVEVGRFLVEEERQWLARELRIWIGAMRNSTDR